MPPPTLVVGTNTYITQAETDTYLSSSVRATSWEFLDSDSKDRAILTAFRIFEKQNWQGVPVGGVGTTPHFPATGLTDCDGNAVSSASVPQEVKDAQAELAFDLTQDSGLETTGGTGSNVKRVQAGSARVTFFNQTGGADGTGSRRFKPQIHELIGCFLEGSAGSPPKATGSDVSSSFDDDGYCLTDGFA